MSAYQSLIINIVIISLCQIYLIINYLRKKEIAKFLSNLIIYVIIVSLLLFEHYLKLAVPNFIIVCSLLAVIGHLLIGEYFNIYHSTKHFDRYLHLFGAFSFSLLSYSLLNKISALANEKWITFLFVMLLGVAIGTLFEIIEFIHDSISKKTLSQHGLTDTNLDLIFNAIGSLIAGFVSTIVFY